MEKHIVIVEDEPDILEVLTYNLEREGFKVTGCSRGDTGWQTILQQKPDLAILDLMLPGMDGLEICQNIRRTSETKATPVLMVTAKGEESDVVLGLGLGADDYISKPFSPKEIVARVKASFRRKQLDSENQIQIKQSGILTYGELVIDSERYSVRYSGNLVKLTATEFRLLLTLAEQPGRVLSREQLMDKAYVNDVIVVDRNIDVHIRAIRKKLGTSFTQIDTIRGVGYCFNA